MGYQLVSDFSQEPIEVFDGFDPDTLILSPSACGLSRKFRRVDLLREIQRKYLKDQLGQMYKGLYESIPTQVVVYNKSSLEKESLDGYLAVIPSITGDEKRIVLFSFFEVSPLRYHCYIHKVYSETSANPRKVGNQ